MAQDPLAPLYEQYFASLPKGYVPRWDFAYVGTGNEGGDQLYVRPARSYAQQFPGFSAIREKFAVINPDYTDPQWSWYFEDPGYTQQDFATGQVPDAQMIPDPSALTGRQKEDYDLWQKLLSIGQMRQEAWSPWGDQFSQALMALQLATGAAGSYGAFAAAAPAAEGAATSATTAAATLPGTSIPLSTAWTYAKALVPGLINVGMNPSGATVGSLLGRVAGAYTGVPLLGTVGGMAGRAIEGMQQGDTMDIQPSSAREAQLREALRRYLAAQRDMSRG